MTSTTAPVSGTDRIDALDLLRGFAVLGILVMNVQSYGMPGSAYFFPTSFGDMSGLNGLVWWIGDLFFESKFITLFSLLFGAGVALMSDRANAAGRGFAGLHYRRMGWLLAIGLIHAYALWHGDILVTYAVCGLWLFLWRRSSVRKLVIWSMIFLLIGSSMSCLSGWSSRFWPEETVVEMEEGFFPPQEEIDTEVADMQGSYAEQSKHRIKGSAFMHATVLPWFMFWRGMGVMLLGMALYRSGFLSGDADVRTYRRWLLIGFPIGLALTMWGNWRTLAIEWDVLPSFFHLGQYSYWGSIPMALGWISLWMLIRRSGAAAGLQVRLKAAGRMALTNYLSQTVLCVLIFTGTGLGLFGRVPRIGQAALVVAIWALQLAWSPWWLARFRFGPAEWLWRSLSYRRRQPMKRIA